MNKLTPHHWFDYGCYMFPCLIISKKKCLKPNWRSCVQFVIARRARFMKLIRRRVLILQEAPYPNKVKLPALFRSIYTQGKVGSLKILLLPRRAVALRRQWCLMSQKPFPPRSQLERVRLLSILNAPEEAKEWGWCGTADTNSLPSGLAKRIAMMKARRGQFCRETISVVAHGWLLLLMKKQWCTMLLPSGFDTNTLLFVGI